MNPDTGHTVKERPVPGRKYLFYSLRTRLHVLSFLIVLLPMVLATWSTIYVLKKHIIADMEHQLRNDVFTASLVYKNEVGRVRASIHAVSLDNTIKTTLRLGGLSQLNEHLGVLAGQYRLDFLLITDPLGNLHASPYFDEFLAGDLYDHPIIFETLLQGLFAGTVLEENATLLHFLELGGKDIDHAPMVTIEAACPIVVREKILGVVLGGRLVTGDCPMIEKMQQATGGARVALVAENIVAATGKKKENGSGLHGLRFPGTIDFTVKSVVMQKDMLHRAADANEQVYAYQTIDMPGVEPVAAIACFRPLASFQDVIGRIRNLMLAIFTAGMLLSLVLTMFMFRSIAVALHQLTMHMISMHRGERIKLLPVQRDDEIGELIGGFNRMATSIDGHIEELNKEITSRGLAEQMLASESERLQVTLQSIGDGVIATDTNGTITLMNRVAEELTGWFDSESLGLPASEVLRVHDPLKEREGYDLGKLIAVDSRETTSGDLMLKAKTGDEQRITVSCAPLLDSGKRRIGAVLVVRNVTERRKLEEELAKSKKLESVGVLAGGIAHDFNNLLTAIIGNLSLARMASEAGRNAYVNIVDAEMASQRACDLSRQLLTFSRGGAPVKNNIDLSEIIRESAGFVARGSKVKVDFEIADNLWLAKADAGQVGQVIDNLVINGIQAMPEGGKIKVGAVNYQLSDSSPLPLAPGHYIQISVEDAGPGISRENLDKIFDPYFTTKETGNGLGLAVCYSIVSKHGGHMIVDSVVGSGTIFYVYLPAVDTDDEKKYVKSVYGKTPVPGSGRILIMDDDEMVLKVAGVMLKTMGYTVEHAADGEEAVKTYQEALGTDRSFDAVIMDLTIPGGMGGKDAIARLLDVDPGVKAIISSGYSRNEVMTDYRKYGFCGVVVKPYRIAELSRVVKEMLS